MIDHEAVPLPAILRGSAAKVLLHLLLNPGGSRTNAAIMLGSGVTDRKTYYAARAQLQALGVWENPACIIPQVGGNTPQGGGNYPTGEGKNPPRIWVGTTDPTTGVPPFTLPVPRVSTTVEATVIHHDEPPDFLAQVCEADRMDDSGDWNSSRSPCRLRRATQVRALQGAYKELFTSELTESSAIDLLRFGGGSAEAVYEALQTAKERKAQYPVGYTKSILKAQATPTTAPQVRSAQIEKGEEGSIMMSDFSPEYKRKLEKMRAAGLLEEDEDD